MDKHNQSLNIPLKQSSSISDKNIEIISKILAKQIDQRIFNEKYAPVKEVLKIIGIGALCAVSIALPNLPKALKPLINDFEENNAWKRFNIPYLKRTLERLQKENLIEIDIEHDFQIVRLTKIGKRKILKIGLDEITVQKPKSWDNKWRLISYDIPKHLKSSRDSLNYYLKRWKFYPLHESVFLHAYPCEKQVDFIREFLGLEKFVRIFTVTKIENDKVFRDFFGV